MTIMPIIQHSAIVDMETEELGDDTSGQVLEPPFVSSQGYMCHFQAFRHCHLPEYAKVKEL